MSRDKIPESRLQCRVAYDRKQQRLEGRVFVEWTDGRYAALVAVVFIAAMAFILY